MNRTIVIAPDSFKGSLAARDVASALADGWRSIRPDDTIMLLPQADGGEGTLDAVAAAVPESIRHDVGLVTGPDGRPTPGVWLELPGGVAVVELAQMSGLPMMERLDPLGATTFGLGEVIRVALGAGARKVVIGLGGSASTDGGAGALAALGLRQSDGRALPLGGGGLAEIRGLDRSGLVDPPVDGVVLLSDVDAPLLGPTGAAAVFGPQKGATPEQVMLLDDALAQFTELLGEGATSDGATTAGAGAAGGTGYGFIAAWGAIVEPGANYLAKLSGLPEAIASADVLLTGEGRFDATSSTGKLVGQLILLAEGHDLRIGIVAGQITSQPVSTDKEPLWSAALADLAGSVDAAIAEPARWLRVAGAAAARALGE